MEIFLLLVVLALLIIFYINHNARFKRLLDHLDHLQRKVQDQIDYSASSLLAARMQAQKEAGADEQIKEEKKIVSEKKSDIPLIREEENILEKKEEKLPPPVVEKKEPVLEKVELPVNDIPDPVRSQPRNEPQPGWWERFKQNNPDLEKFIGENLLSKIAISILVLGVAFFVKYAIDKEWINEAARVGIGLLCGCVIMAFAHRLHQRFKGFSSVLVAGAIAIFYFTIGIGFHEYHIFSQTTAFIIMVVITAFSVLVSIGYDRIELAALSVIGGFAVPFMVSTGQGNYKVLFMYILILDIGMLVLAYVKKWNLINILSYAFTILIYCGWLGSRVLAEPAAPYRGAFFFGLVFYTVFVLMNVINNVKAKRTFSYPELIILVSNTFVFYISGMLILKEWAWQYKGIYTVAMGTFNFILAAALYRLFKADRKLVYLLVGLTLSFATLAAPVQLKGSYITLFWAVETALLVWLAQRSGLKGFNLASMIVAGFTFISLMMDNVIIYGINSNQQLAPLTNIGFITGLCSALFLFAASWFSKAAAANGQFKRNTYGLVLLIASVFLLYLAGLLEITHQSNYYLYSSNSVSCVTSFYHIAFTSVLGALLLSKYGHAGSVISFVLLCINALYYSVYYSAPYQELQERCRGDHGDSIGFYIHFFSFLAIAMHMTVTIAGAVRRRDFLYSARGWMLWIFGIFSVIIISNEVILNGLMMRMNSFSGAYDEVYMRYDDLHSHLVKVALPVLWGMIAFVFLSLGIKRQIKTLRLIALALLAVTLVKLFAFDIKKVSEGGKIIAFILLGVVLLVMSFMYQKIKALILNEEKKTDTDENTTA